MSKNIFNFEMYPELKSWHTKYNKLTNKMYNAEIRFDKTTSLYDKNLWSEAINELEIFTSEYAEIIFEILNKKKPNLLDLSTNSYVKWETVFVTETNIRRTVNLVEQAGGRWRLPPEYYIEK